MDKKREKRGNNWTAFFDPETGRYFAEIMYTSREGREQYDYEITEDIFERLGTFRDDVDNERLIKGAKMTYSFENTMYGTLGPERVVWDEEAYGAMMGRDKKKKYKFYGWETADVTDARGFTPRDYYDLLSDIWCADTCAPRMRSEWTKENKTLGQCSITAFLMQDIFGGKVFGIPLENGSVHCFNVVGDCVFDLTSEQFGGKALNYEECPEQSREEHFAKEEKRLRYEYLKARLEAALG